MATANTDKPKGMETNFSIQSKYLPKKLFLEDLDGGTYRYITNLNLSTEDETGNTYWYTLHAEANCILKAAKNGNRTDDSILYITSSPCKECSKLIIQSGITAVIFSDFYRDLEGLDTLNKIGISLIYIKI